MAKPLQIRKLTLGDGQPKICVPLVESQPEALVWGAVLARAAAADLVEWRADYMDAAGDPAALLRAAGPLRAALQDTPLLFTLRTKAEGGRSDPGREQYREIGKALAASGLIDLLDIELSQGEENVNALLAAAKNRRVCTVVSSHDFAATPPREAMLGRLQRIRRLGADIPKLAAMPKSFADVLSLMAVTEQFAREADCPVITMSMGELGQLSRVAGRFTGSAVTFGVAGEASAPGQLPIAKLREMLAVLGGGPEDGAG